MTDEMMDLHAILEKASSTDSLREMLAFGAKRRRRGLRGAKLVISDAHEGIKASVSKLMNATRQRCRVHTMRNAFAHSGKSSRRVVSAFMATAFEQDSAEAAKAQWRKVAASSGRSCPSSAPSWTRPRNDVLAYKTLSCRPLRSGARHGPVYGERLHVIDLTLKCTNVISII